MPNESTNACTGRLSELDAFLYGLPGGFVLAGLLLLCFITFGRAITARKKRNIDASASSITRPDLLGKRKKKGPPPSSDLRPVDVNAIAHHEGAPDDIKAMLKAKTALASKKNASKSDMRIYRHGPTKLSNPEPDYKQWAKDFFTGEGKEFVKRETKRIVTKPFRQVFKKMEYNKTNIFEDFDSDESIKKWKCVADSDTFNGFSTSNLVRSRFGHGLFHGVMSTRIPDDGLTMNSGFSAIIGPQAPRDSLTAVETHYDWTDYNCFEIKFRGDGRKYSIVINTATYKSDLEYYDAHGFPLYTRGGPYWQTYRIPFSKFIFMYKGLIQDSQFGLRAQRVRFVAVALEDKIDGPFSLEIDYMGLRTDTSPFPETCAYELYDFRHVKYVPVHPDCEAPEPS